jgi:hypothetical protein
MTAYAQIFEGLRGYYAKYPSRRGAAGFHAAMTMSFICGIALAGGITVTDYLLHRNIDWSVALSGRKFLLLLAGVVIAYAHVQFGKSTGRYTSVAPAEPSRWKRYLCIYAGFSGLLFAGALILAFHE